MIKVYAYTPQDYPILKAWLDAHDAGACSQEILDSGHGIIAEKDGVPVTFACGYFSDKGGVAMIEWVVSNPAASSRDVYECLKHTIGALCEMASANNCRHIFCNTTSTGIQRMLERHNWISINTTKPHNVLYVWA